MVTNGNIDILSVNSKMLSKAIKNAKVISKNASEI